MDGESDDELVARVAHGDRRAFGVLVERRSGGLMALAYRITGDRAAAEDVVQETFVRAWTKAPAWAADPRRAAYSTWLGRVTVNLAIDHRRKVVPLPLAAAAEPVDPAPSAEDSLQAGERQVRLLAEVARLPERQRAALSLTYDLGLSNAEAAKALSTSVGALELLLVRARKALRAALSEERSPAMTNHDKGKFLRVDNGDKIDTSGDDNLDAMIAAAFAADTPPPPPPAIITAHAVRHAQERAAPAWLQPRPARIGWAAAGVFALVLGCAAGAASRIAAVPSDLDTAFGAVATTPAGGSNAG